MQLCDQEITVASLINCPSFNSRALALNCNVPLNKNGAEATNWKGGKPVRVVRNAKGRKHSKFAPEDGNR